VPHVPKGKIVNTDNQKVLSTKWASSISKGGSIAEWLACWSQAVGPGRVTAGLVESNGSLPPCLHMVQMTPLHPITLSSLASFKSAHFCWTIYRKNMVPKAHQPCSLEKHDFKKYNKIRQR